MAYVATVTVPAGKVASTLTNFVTMVDLAHMPSGWWSAIASDGSDIRVRQGGSDIPFHVARIDSTARVGTLFFKGTLTTAANTFTVEQVAGATTPAVTSPIGRNAVWSDYLEVYVSSLTSATGTGHDLVATAGSDLTNWPIVAASPNVNAHQGVAVDTSGNFYVIDTNTIKKYDSSWNLLATNSNPIAATGIASVNHLGDGTVVGGELFIPLEVYPSGPYANQHVTVWSLSDLSFKRSYNISAAGHEVSSICYNPDDGYWYIPDFTSPAGDSVLHKYDSTFAHVGTLTLTTAFTAKQGIAYSGGYFYITTDSTNDASRGVWRFNADGTGGTRIVAGKFSSNLEGITVDASGNLYLLHDNGSTTSYVTKHSYSGLSWLTAGSGYATASGLTNLTTWTMGVSFVNVDYGRNRALLSWGTTGTGNTSRATLAIQDSNDRLGLWNSTDSWVEDATAVVGTGVRERVHATQNGTTDRKVWRNGSLRATDLGTAQRPVTGDVLSVGTEDASHAENANGVLSLIYIRSGVLSADWIAAEVASWESPAAFYTVTEPTIAGTLDETFPALTVAAEGSIPLAFDYTFPAFRTAINGETTTAGPLDVTFAALAVALDGTLPDVAAGSLAATFPSFRVGLVAEQEDSILTDTRYDLDGRWRDGLGLVETEDVVTPVPVGLSRATRVDKALAYPPPDIDNGRPT